jgi:hypothetical protein
MIITGGHVFLVSGDVCVFPALLRGQGRLSKERKTYPSGISHVFGNYA